MARVLVVDDDNAVREVLQLILRRAGYDVHVAGNGLEALEKMRTGGADLVLLDIEMPGMNGLEFCEQLRADPAWQKIPVIMMTGRPVQGLSEKANRVGAIELVSKPFERVTLLEKIKASL
ncbi:MAG: response regulator [Nibricoccus sp.]